MGKRQSRQKSASASQSPASSASSERPAPHTSLEMTQEATPFDVKSERSLESQSSSSEIQPEMASPISEQTDAATAGYVPGVDQASRTATPIHISGQPDMPMPEKAATCSSPPITHYPQTWTGVTLMLTHLLLRYAFSPVLSIEICRSAKSWFTYGGKPAGYNQRIRQVRRQARLQILHDSTICPEQRLEQISDRRVHRVIGAVKMLFPNVKANDANVIAVRYEVVKAMKEAKFTDDEIHDLVYQVSAMVFIPNRQEIQALIMLNSGPAQATIQFKEELERGTNLGEGLGLFNNWYRIFPSVGAIN